MLYIFDMGGVVTNTAKVIEPICKILHLSEDAFMSYCTDLVGSYSDGAITTSQFWETFSKRSGKTVKTDWWHCLFHPVRNEKTYEIICQLKKAGNRVVCGTNTIDSHYRNHCERGDYTVFDQVYASCFMGVSKPNKEFWEVILTSENVDAKDAVFIDDREENCAAAAALGIRAIRYLTAEALAKEIALNSLQEDR